MDYTINQLARLAGVTTRTLRYYDQVGLLKPRRVSGNGYRIYDSQSVDQLQLILFYRELDLGLDEIQMALEKTARNPLDILSEQRQMIIARLEQTQCLLETLDRILAAHQGGMNMSDQAKFEGLKKRQLEDNERQYGEEIRANYGEENVRISNKRYLNQDQSTYQRAEQLSAAIITHLLLAMDQGDPASEQAREVVALHKDWLQIYWPSYSAEAHVGLGEMYVADERFTQYYDQHRAGAAQFLCDAITFWAHRLT
ncbi:MAG: MerR family transcriptional regulator [Clostridia bacterium]|nr:MerR family transcriptional regulator [Clostridia bacterium]